MKKLFLFAVAALTLTACSNDEIVNEIAPPTGNEPKEIALFAVGQPSTRAVVDGTTFPDADNFDVVAYLADGGSAAGDFFPSTNFEKNYRGGVSGGASDGLWAGTTARYWPLSASHINFLAVTNTSGNGVTGKVSTAFGETSGETTSNYAKKAVVTLTKNDVDGATTVWSQADLMYAAGQGKVTQTSGSNTLTFPASVGMEFQHALAWIDFKVKTSTTTTGVDIKVNSITLNGAHYNGTYTITNDGTSSSSGNGYDGANFTIGYNTTADQTTASDWRNLVGVWSNSSSTATKLVPNDGYTDAAGTSATLTAAPAQYGGGLLVIPDGFAAESSSPYQNKATGFTMNYTITQGGVATTYDYTYTFAAAEKIWKQRKHYTYIIDITLHEILVEPTVQDWVDETPHIVAVPQFSYAEGAVAGTYNVANTAGTYTATITGCTNSTSYDITEDSESDVTWITEVTPVTSDASGNLTFSFTVTAQDNNAAARSVNLVFTNSSNKTKVTITQAAGESTGGGGGE